MKVPIQRELTLSWEEYVDLPQYLNMPDFEYHDGWEDAIDAAAEPGLVASVAFANIEEQGKTPLNTDWHTNVNFYPESQ